MTVPAKNTSQRNNRPSTGMVHGKSLAVFICRLDVLQVGTNISEHLRSEGIFGGLHDSSITGLRFGGDVRLQEQQLQM
jgi:hypothetical protein